MTIDAAFAALVEANPIPDAEAYAEHRLEPAAFLTAIRGRTTDMQTVEKQFEKGKKPRRRWPPIAAVAAFVVVLAVGIMTFAAFRGGDSDVADVPAPPFDTPQEAVEAWVSAQNAGDGETYLLLFAQDASDGSLNQGGIASDKTIIDRVEMVAATETVFSVVECDAQSAVQTECVVKRVNPVWELSQGTPEVDESVVLTIDESGLIIRIGTDEIPGSAYDEARARAHRAWMDINYPELRGELQQNWATDPIDRSAMDIGRESLAAAREFDAQYEG